MGQTAGGFDNSRCSLKRSHQSVGTTLWEESRATNMNQKPSFFWKDSEVFEMTEISLISKKFAARQRRQT